jgi:putative ABC transport system substrate-binding protein
VRRREFITLIGGATAAWPLACRAQQPDMPVIGYLASQSADEFASRVRAFLQGLGEAGYVEGQNVTIVYRWAEGRYDRLPALAAELVHLPVNVLVAPGGSPAALAAKAATSTIPVVFEVGIDPVAAGLVRSLNRPDGNVTGVTSLNVEVGSKRLQLLHELVPSATAVGMLVNPLGPSAAMESKQIQSAADTLGLQLEEVHASREDDFNTAFATWSACEPARW